VIVGEIIDLPNRIFIGQLDPQTVGQGRVGRHVPQIEPHPMGLPSPLEAARDQPGAEVCGPGGKQRPAGETPERSTVAAVGEHPVQLRPRRVRAHAGEKEMHFSLFAGSLGPREAVSPVDVAARPAGAIGEVLPVVVGDGREELGLGRRFKEFGHGSDDCTRSLVWAQGPEEASTDFNTEARRHGEGRRGPGGDPFGETFGAHGCDRIGAGGNHE
jgi:hypothetical protein